MPLDFPSSPVNGQTYDNFYWDASTGVWRNNGSKNALSSRLTSLETAAPRTVASAAARNLLLPSPVQGNSVWRSDLGYEEVYYAVYNATTNPGGRTPAGWYSGQDGGLVPITPSSVTLTGGTGSVSNNGTTTFTTVTNLTLNGVFTPAFSHYKLLIDFTNSSIGEVNYSRMSLSGTPSSANSYKIRGTQQTSNTSPTNWGFDATAFTFGRGAGDSAISLDVFNPQSVKRTRINGQMFGYVTNETAWTFSGTLDTSVQYDGFNIFPNSGSITGNIQVYGYRN